MKVGKGNKIKTSWIFFFNFKTIYLISHFIKYDYLVQKNAA